MRFIALYLLLILPLPAVIAPESIAGKILRTHITWKGTSPRFRQQETIHFSTDSKFTFIKYATGVDLVDWSQAKVDIQEPPFDGTYTYRRISDNEATIVLVSPTGSLREFTLTFTSPGGGGSTDFAIEAFRGNGSRGNGQMTFFLSDFTWSSQTAPSNISMRGIVGAANPLIVGFIVPGIPPPIRRDGQYIPELGEVSKEVVVRVVGPSLSAFGVDGTWNDPSFVIYKDGAPAVLDERATNDWDSAPATRTGLEKLFSWLKAFPLSENSKDAVGVFRLTPGAYTVVCTTADGDKGGQALIEVYFLP